MTNTYGQAGFFTCFFSGRNGSDGQTVHSDILLQTDTFSEVVVMAMYSNRKPADVPIPVAIVGQEEIQSSGASRLDEILSGQTGLAINKRSIIFKFKKNRKSFYPYRTNG